MVDLQASSHWMRQRVGGNPQGKYGYGRAWETSSEGDVDADLEYE